MYRVERHDQNYMSINQLRQFYHHIFRMPFIIMFIIMDEIYILPKYCWSSNYKYFKLKLKNKR